MHVSSVSLLPCTAVRCHTLDRRRLWELTGRSKNPPQFRCCVRKVKSFVKSVKEPVKKDKLKKQK